MKTNKKFLVEYAAVVGRSKEDGSQQEPVYLKFFALVSATDATDAESKVCNYSDPGFTCKIKNVSEFTKETLKSLPERLELEGVIREQDL